MCGYQSVLTLKVFYYMVSVAISDVSGFSRCPQELPNGVAGGRAVTDPRRQ